MCERCDALRAEIEVAQAQADAIRQRIDDQARLNREAIREINRLRFAIERERKRQGLA